MSRRRVAVMGGSFNPVHIGHLMVADYIRQHVGFDRVLMMLSPLNPLKENPSALAPDHQRFEMLEIACNSCQGLEACDLELSMPKPSYTINTLDRLATISPDTKFSLIIGADNWEIFTKWREWERIVDEYGVIIYPRPGSPMPEDLPEGVMTVEAPTIDLSSTFLRRELADGYDMNLFLPQGVYKYIRQHRLYC